MLQERNVSNYAELIAGIRQDNSSAVSNFRNTFAPGIQFFITRMSNEDDVLERVEQVIVWLIQEIKLGHVTGPILPSQILKAVHRSTQHHENNQSLTDAARVAADLLTAIPKREREALKQYYVDLEAENDICAELDLTVDQFRNSRSRFRTQFMHAEKCWRATK